jgi:hypothetical protein
VFGQRKTVIQFIFLKQFISVWVPNSEERKSNPKNPYLGVLVRITKSLYYGGNMPTSESTSVYAGLGSASNSASEYELTKSPIINLN